MSYCEKEDVKKRLKIAEDETEHDSELDDLITEAESIVNAQLSPYITVPLIVVPAVIKYATADYAAALFKDRQRDPSEPASVFYGLADRKIQIYIDATFKRGVIL